MLVLNIRKIYQSPSVSLDPKRAVLWLRTFVLLALFLGSFPSASELAAQDGYQILLNGTVREKADGEKLAGVSVTIFQNGAPFDEIETLRNGKYNVDLPGGFDYRIVYSFEGLSDRVVEITFGDAAVDPSEVGFKLDADMTLFTVPEGFDPAILAKPIGRAAYNVTSATLDFDFPYTSRIQREVEMELARLQQDAPDESKARKEFDEHMRKAEVEFGRERWAQSISWLERALALYPNESRPIEMLTEAEENLARAEDLAAEEAEVSRLMREAKRSMKIEDWSAAQTGFESVLEIRPDELEAASLLAEVLAEIAALEGTADVSVEENEADDALEAEGSGQTGRDRSRGGMEVDSAAEAEKAEREKRKEYDGLIKLADRRFNKDEYSEAKAQYDRALALYPAESYPAERSQVCTDRIVDLTPEEIAGVEASAGPDQAASDRAYEDVVRRADEAFDAKSYLDAQGLYTEAADMRPTERYPQSRLRRLANLLGDGGLDADIEVRNHAAADAADAADAVERAAAEQARMLQEQEMTRAAADAQMEADLASNQREMDQAAALNRSSDYVQALSSRKRDAAEDYYSESLQAEIRARVGSTEVKAENTGRLTGVWTSRSHARRSVAFDDIESDLISWGEDEVYADEPRRERVNAVKTRTEGLQEKSLDLSARGRAMIQENELDIEDKHDALSGMIDRRSGRYKVFADTIDADIKQMQGFHNDRRLAAGESREMQFEAIHRKADKAHQVGRGERDRRLDNLREIERETMRQNLASQQQQLQSEVRSAAAVREVEGKYAGQSRNADDYIAVPAMDDIAVGITERSYEQGNALIIERTVRNGNEVVVYRKTIAKYGVYYFKNDHSISEDVWILETFEVRD